MINLLEAFKMAFTLDDLEGDWQIFANVFPQIIQEDDNLLGLLTRHQAHEKWEIVKEDLLSELEEELTYLPWREKHSIKNSSMLYKAILSIAHHVVVSGLSKILTREEAAYNDAIEGRPLNLCK